MKRLDIRMSKLLLAMGLIALVWGESATAAYQDEVLADNPVAYYRFEETTGTTAIDSSGNGNDGTYNNGVTLGATGAPALGRAGGFDGVDDFVSTARTVSTDFTLEMWVISTAPSLTGTDSYEGNGLLWSDVGGGANDFTMAILNNGLSFFAGDSGSTVTSANAINDGRWHHLVVTRAMGGSTQIYVDGILRGTMPSGNSPLDANPAIMIGGNVLDNRYFNGLVDEVAYYPSVLSAARIQAHFLAGSAPAASVPVMSEGAMAGLIAALAMFGMLALRRRSR
jgi:hypothetical protein